MLRSRRTRLVCLIACVLPVLLLRASSPAGFMAASVDGNLQIVLCQSDMMTGGHHHHHHDARGGASIDVDPTCPYAQSAGPALMPVLPLLPTVAAMHCLESTAPISHTRNAFGPRRQQSPRGPPTLA